MLKKLSLSVMLKICLFFAIFEPRDAYKGDKKKRVLQEHFVITSLSLAVKIYPTSYGNQVSLIIKQEENNIRFCFELEKMMKLTFRMRKNHTFAWNVNKEWNVKQSPRKCKHYFCLSVMSSRNPSIYSWKFIEEIC